MLPRLNSTQLRLDFCRLRLDFNWFSAQVGVESRDFNSTFDLSRLQCDYMHYLYWLSILGRSTRPFKEICGTVSYMAWYNTRVLFRHDLSRPEPTWNKPESESEVDEVDSIEIDLTFDLSRLLSRVAATLPQSNFQTSGKRLTQRKEWGEQVRQFVRYCSLPRYRVSLNPGYALPAQTSNINTLTQGSHTEHPHH